MAAQGGYEPGHVDCAAPPSTPQTSSTSQTNSPTCMHMHVHVHVHTHVHVHVHVRVHAHTRPTSPPSADAALDLRLRHGLAKVWLGPLLPCSSSESSHSAKWPPLPRAK